MLTILYTEKPKWLVGFYTPDDNFIEAPFDFNEDQLALPDEDDVDDLFFAKAKKTASGTQKEALYFLPVQSAMDQLLTDPGQKISLKSLIRTYGEGFANAEEAIKLLNRLNGGVTSSD